MRHDTHTWQLTSDGYIISSEGGFLASEGGIQALRGGLRRLQVLSARGRHFDRQGAIAPIAPPLDPPLSWTLLTTTLFGTRTLPTDTGTQIHTHGILGPGAWRWPELRLAHAPELLYLASCPDVQRWMLHELSYPSRIEMKTAFCDLTIGSSMISIANTLPILAYTYPSTCACFFGFEGGVNLPVT